MNELGQFESCDTLKLIEALMHSGKLTEARFDSALAAVGLSAAKMAVLRHLAQADGQLPLGQLAERLSCAKSNVTQLVDRLESEKLVRRTPYPEDRRITRAELTGEGWQRYATGQEVMREFERQLLGDYSPEERLLLHKLLARLEGSGIASV